MIRFLVMRANLEAADSEEIRSAWRRRWRHRLRWWRIRFDNQIGVFLVSRKGSVELVVVITQADYEAWEKRQKCRWNYK